MTTLSQLAIAYQQAKDEEARATALRRELAAQIQALTGHESEKQKTYQDGDWRITVKAPLIHSLDWKAWEIVKEQIHPDLHPTKIKEELDPKGVEWLRENDPATYLVLSQALIVKPGAVQVTVKGVE